MTEAATDIASRMGNQVFADVLVATAPQPGGRATLPAVFGWEPLKWWEPNAP